MFGLDLKRNALQPSNESVADEIFDGVVEWTDSLVREAIHPGDWR
jgi:hypothetical protein